MDYSETISHFSQEYLSIHSWQDGIEIIFFATMIYAISTWLKQDQSHKLLPAFYGYVTLFCSSYFFELQTLQTTLLFAAPVIATLSIIYHQKQLQKNFILARKQPLEPKKIAAPNWIETCIRSCLVIAHQKKEITCIIESRDSIRTMIEHPFLLDIHVQKNLLNLLLLSDSFQPSKPILLKRTGKIVSVNCSWSDNLMNDSLFSAISNQPEWQKYGSIITEKSDALLFHINAEPSKSGICYQGEVIQKMTSEQVLQFIKQVMYKQNKESVTFKKGMKNENERHTSL